MTQQQPQAPSFFHRYLQEAFSVDTRSLALLRIAIGLIVIFNLFTIVNELPTFYSESGVLPSELSQEVSLYRGKGAWSLLWLSDSANWMFVCVGLTGFAAVALVLGFHSTIATAICLVMMWSFQIRNPLILTAGDVLLRMVLVWGLLLPWGSKWSVDARHSRKSSPKQLTSFASAGLLLQLASIYFFSGIAKFNGEWSGSALAQTLNLEMYVNGWGNRLAGYSQNLEWLAIIVLVLEIVGPVILFLPLVNQYWRGMMMALMWIMHLIIALTMSIGIFSMVATVTWFAFIPGSVWNLALGRIGLPKKRSRSSDSSTNQVLQYVGGVLLVFVILLNVDKIGVVRGRILPEQVDALATTMMIQQEFKMFANPPSSSPWPQYRSTLNNNEVVELFAGDMEPYSGEKPKSVYRYMQSQSWRRYHFNLIDGGSVDSEPPPIYATLRKRLLQYQVDAWNRRETKSNQVASASLFMNFDQFDKSGQPNGETTRRKWAELLAD